MRASAVLLYLAASGASATHLLAARIPQTLAQRDTVGGWSLQTDTCPSNTQQCTHGCCPSSTTCQDPGTDQVSICCPSSSVCQGQFQASPKCADSSWNLWKGLNGNPFCCEPGKIGTYHYEDGVAGSCVDKDTNVPYSASAVQIGTGVGGTTSTASSSSASTSAPASTTTSSSSASATAASSTSAAAASTESSSASSTSGSSSSKSTGSSTHSHTSSGTPSSTSSKTSATSTGNSTGSAPESKPTNGSGRLPMFSTAALSVMIVGVAAALL
ncbi:hypothetical protein L228DRAFT_243727 [Xylona heveae TC161]|uniref:Uncharacterized protein n=1 Tax=Xylona heveae (strain CBS 132557 / TC161) TaxID=1328760 RepID=A0A165IJ32_XYLHT|nr:hypothetical protein L228DRAFT_243727 [Xylona heveae TC161]KZF24964.1 hypothetical protein L228DRAFT_243727 [Xylona heveae TC161]